ncbi:outer membrane protein transport protein [uncultured Microbulbifer sp.]|uniref:OmpP1/FadL family transporter n=1 Tax=uncultured Microbulbifer sp. TaxID=348147 RepID=UPI0026244B6B|nr:outer membrane protein transport protein [uncultured Microbulbifer sp.]
MNKKYLPHAVLAVAISSVSQGAMAAAFYISETSTSGLGRAFAGENTIGDNAAILGRNPAGSALFDTYTFSIGATFVDPEIDVAGDVTYFVPVGVGPDGSPIFLTERARANDYATTAWVPNGYLAAPINDEWSFGLALYTDYGLETDFPNSFRGTPIANKTRLITVNIQPSVAYDINNTLSIGASVNFLYADARLRTTVPTNFALDPILGTDLSGTSILNIEGDDWDVSWTVGALWRISENTRAGISYHAEYDPKLKGNVNSDLLPSPLDPFDNASGNVTVDLPDTLELGFYHRFNSKWAIALGYMWADWDDLQRLEAFIPGAGAPFNPLIIGELNFESGSRYSIGVEYFYNDKLTLRAGYAFDESAARDGLNREETEMIAAQTGLELPITWRILSIPDTDRQWLTLGATYHVSEKLSIDGGVAYLSGDDERIQEFGIVPPAPIPVPTFFDGGTTRTAAWLYGVSLNYHF